MVEPLPLHERPLPQQFTTVLHMLADTAARVPDREALAFGPDRLSYRAYLSCVCGFAAELVRLCGYPLQGHRVAIILPNSIDTCIAILGAQAAGAQVVPLNPLYTSRELELIVADASPLVLVCEASRQEMLAPLAARCGVAHVVNVSAPGGSLLRWSDSNASQSMRWPAADDLAFVQYTGGTTGRSKGVMLTHCAVVTNVAQREWALPTSRDGERVLCVMPLFHSYALAMGLFLAAYCGGTLVILPRYRPDDVLKTLVEESITIFPGSPTIFTGLMAHAAFGGTDFSKMHTCYSGSAALPQATLQQWESATGAPIYEGYGQTEAGPILTYIPVGGKRCPGSVGLALPETQVEIVDLADGGRTLGPGKLGEIRAKGPQIMLGYRNLALETQEALRDGWLYTGDIGEFDEEGYLFIRDRKKDMVIVGGYNVYPREVDEVLLSHRAVLDAASVGAPDSYRGEVLKAFVTFRDGSGATAEELIAHCTKNLAKYKVPVSITVLDALPKTSVNKTDKLALKALAVQN
jgi:long-chain acyl-CoA synthetase